MMRSNRKWPKIDLRKYYLLFLEGSLIIVLLFVMGIMKINLKSTSAKVDLTDEQEVVKMEDIIQTEHQEKPPPPPPPEVPVEVPNDEIIEDQILNIDSELILDDKLEMPPPPENKETEEDFFIVVEEQPKLIGGMAWLQKCPEYPEMARKAGIEGRVTIQFIVNKKGEIENPKVIRGIGGGADEEALRCVKKAKFIPGRQRGKPVRVQYSVPVFFKLRN